MHEHTLQVNSNSYTPVDSESVPTGAIEPSDNTPLQCLGSSSTAGDCLREALSKLPDGVDHNFVLRQEDPHRDTSASSTLPGTHTMCDTNQPSLLLVVDLTPTIKCKGLCSKTECASQHLLAFHSACAGRSTCTVEKLILSACVFRAVLRFVAMCSAATGGALASAAVAMSWNILHSLHAHTAFLCVRKSIMCGRTRHSRTHDAVVLMSNDQ